MKAERWKELWKKYKYVCWVLVAGVTLMLLPGKAKQESRDADRTMQISAESLEAAEQHLTGILQKIDSVGRVSVCLSIRSSEERVYLKDEGETVLINSGSGTQQALERKVVCPVYQGAIIVCDGAGDAAVQLQVLEAVRQYTGLRSDQISILPMKQ